METAGPRRVQYSSCDQCRKARVACDAVRIAHNALRDSNSCTRCVIRKQRCTFEWVNEVRKDAQRSSNRKKRARRETSISTRQGRSVSANTETLSTNSYSHPTEFPHTSLSPQPPGDLESLIDLQWLRTVYSETWETIFGHWLSRHGCPFIFGDENTAESFVSISSVCGQLDKWMSAESGTAIDHTYSGFDEGPVDIEMDHNTRTSLERVIHAFAARWLALVAPPDLLDATTVQEIVVKLWREARADMLNVIHRPTYRSFLTLYLFGLTPVPEGISDDEELCGMSGSLCVQAALQQVYTLRMRSKSLQYNGAKVSPVAGKTFSLSPDPIATTNFINAENILHWGALIVDNSASLTLSCRPLMSSGLFGFESEWWWCLVSSCTELFKNSHNESDGSELVESRASQVIAAAAMYKQRLWKQAAVFREALRDGHEEATVSRICSAYVEGLEQYREVYGGLVEACQKRIHFFSQALKLRWQELIMHQNIGILLVVDAIEATERFDLLPALSTARADAEASILNALKFGIENTYSITVHTGISPNSEKTEDGRISVPILAIDPYPHHVVAAVQLMRKAVNRDLATDKINPEAHTNLLSILRKALDLLPGSSKSVVSARNQADLSGI